LRHILLAAIAEQTRRGKLLPLIQRNGRSNGRNQD